MPRERKYKKKKLGSYPFISVVFSTTLALFVMGLFGLLLLLTNSLTHIIQENVEVQVFLNKDLSKSETTKIIKILSTKDFVVRKDGDALLEYITEDEAAKQFIQETGEDFVQFLGDNPLRDVITIKVSPNYHDPKNLAEIKKDIEYIRGVYEVSYIESLVSSINTNVRKVGAILIGFALILLIVVVILINNTIKLALFSQRFLIRSMQLVGATTRFIRGPFLRNAALFGLMAGCLATGMVWSVIQIAEREIGGIAGLLDLEQLAILAGALLLMGLLVGYVSTFSAMRKYMKMSLDELY